MLGPRHEIARLQSDFYRDAYHKMLRWLLVSIFIMFALTAAVFYLVLFQPNRQYYANTTQGKIFPIPAIKTAG
jgi:hypothetical protein